MPEIVNLEESSLRSFGRSRKPTQQEKESNNSTLRKMFGLFTVMIFATVSNLKSVIPEPRPYIYFTRGLKQLEYINTLFEISINVFHAMMFAAKQEHNETYTFKYMLHQDDC